MIFTIVKVSAGTLPSDNDAYLSDNILSSVKDISISKLLDFRKISTAINDEFDKARFHYIIAYEIDNRLNDLDGKFNAHEVRIPNLLKHMQNNKQINSENTFVKSSLL